MGIAANYKIIKQFKNKSASEISAGTGISKQNLSTWENERSDPGKEFVDKLSRYFGLPKELFYKEGLTLEFLEKNHSGQNITSVQKGATVTGNHLGVQERAMVAFQEALKDESPYRVVPKSLLEGKYALYLETEIKEKNELLWTGLKAKDELIIQLKEEIQELRRRLSGPA